MNERWRTRAWLVAAAALWLAPASPAAADPAHEAALSGLHPTDRASGLVLGLRQGDAYRTLYLTHRGGDVRLARDVPVLVSPQADGFWRLGSVSVALPAGCAPGTCVVSATRVWASPGPPDLAGLTGALGRDAKDAVASASDAFYDLAERIEYVANGTVCRSSRLEAWAGGAHPSFLSENHCLPLTTALDDAAPLAYAPARGDAFRGATAALQDAFARGEFEEQPLPPAEVAEAGLAMPAVDRLPFRLSRRDGTAHVTLLAYADAPYVLSNTYTLTVAAEYGPADPPVAPYNPVPAFLPALRAAEPALRDVFVSPAENVAFVLTADRLAALAVPTGATLWSMPIAFDQVVMAEWAVGDSTDRWTRMIGEAAR